MTDIVRPQRLRLPGAQPAKAAGNAPVRLENVGPGDDMRASTGHHHKTRESSWVFASRMERWYVHPVSSAASIPFLHGNRIDGRRHGVSVCGTSRLPMHMKLYQD